MRIVAGEFKGRQIVAPTGRDTRPTTDRVRESLFNKLEHNDGGLSGKRVLDLFAGSGALGLEALSRGASFALFVDTDAKARGAIRENIEALSLTGRTRLFRRDAYDLGPKPANVGDAFDLVFMDPPYADEQLDRLVNTLLTKEWLADGAQLVIERGSDQIPIDNDTVRLLDHRRYGDCHLFFYKLERKHA